MVHIDASALDNVVCVWIRARLDRITAAAARARAPHGRPVRRVLAVDGKTMRGTLRGKNRARLLAAHSPWQHRPRGAVV